MIQLHINDLIYNLGSFDFRISQNEKENSSAQFQKVVSCELQDIIDIENVFSAIIETFDGDFEIDVKNIVFPFEGYSIRETGLFVNSSQEISVQLSFWKDFL